MSISCALIVDGPQMLPLGSLLFPLLYVLPLYFQGSSLPRDHPKTIWFRITITSASCIALSWMPTYFALRAAPAASDISLDKLLTLMAIRSGGLLAAVALPLALLVVLFSGSLALDHLDGQPLGRLPSGPVAVRNLVAAPFTEELCFRAGLISYLTANGTSRAKCIWLSPTLFGLAHLHHAAELVRHQNWTVKHAILACFMQFLYTSAFGWFAAFLFLRTGHLAAVVVAHAFCNFMGLPRFQDVPGHPKAALLVVLFIGGIVGFSVLLHPLTEPALYGYPPGQHYPSTP